MSQTAGRPRMCTTSQDVEVTLKACVYRVDCTCGELLKFEAEVDSDGDLLLKVEPCEVCTEEP